MKNNKLNIIVMFLLITISVLKVYANNNLSLLGKVIYIDPGHGGVDPGAIYKDIQEKKINLEISKILKKELERNGAIVYMTRNNDNDLASINASERKRSDLSNRAKLINTSNANLYISIHLNTYQSPKWKGAQMFYDDINKSNKLLAQILQQEFKNKRKIKEINNLYMYRNIKIPGILAEVGFLSNPSERNLLQTKEYQKQICEKLVNGISKYLN